MPFQLQQIFEGNNILQEPASYGLPEGISKKEESDLRFQDACKFWQSFNRSRKRTDLSEKQRLDHTTNFIKQLLYRDLGYHVEDIDPIFVPYQTNKSSQEDRFFPVTILANDIPLAIVSSEHTLDELHPEVTYTNGKKKSKTAFQVIQELLNGMPEYNWGFVCNGLTLRMAHKATALSRNSYVEFDLESMFESGNNKEFFFMWALLHASRTKCNDQGQNIWDLWLLESLESGQPAREALGRNLEEALFILGNGFLKTPGNEELLNKIRSKALSPQDFQHQLLQLIYRFLFVFTLEERHILNTRTKDNALACQRYEDGYAFHRFIIPSSKIRFQNDYCDAWSSVVLVFKALDQGESKLALPALGGLFKNDRCADLISARLSNRYFFQAMEKMRWIRLDGTPTTIDYKNMGTEELGSIYEGLLELIPQLDPTKKSFSYLYASGNERKSSGSYYTPDELVQSLIKSALDPVIEQKLDQHPEDPEQALLSLSVIDPACGSGHFLLAAARRIAEKLTEIRAGNEVQTPQLYRRSLHDVIKNCIFGVDLNPMAVELSRIALWLEGFAENTPLSFLDHHIKTGNALLGIYDLEMVKSGIPDEAYATTDKEIVPEFSLTHKTVCTKLKAQNKKERINAQKHPDMGVLPLFQNQLSQSYQDLEQADENEKEKIYEKYKEQQQQSSKKIACDLYLAAFLSPKTTITANEVPTSKDIFQYLNDPKYASTETKNRGEKAAKICEKYHVFHWAFEFPEQCEHDNGFDCVLGNPPWEKPKVEDEKWFAGKIQNIVDAPKAADRKKMITALAKGTFGSDYLHISESPERKNYEQDVYRQYVQEKHFYAVFANFDHLSADVLGRFPLTGVGDTNLYAYFAELANNIRKPQGSAGLVIPAGIISDNSTQAFSRNIFKGQLRSVYHFDNTKKIFKDVDGRYSFVLLTLQQSEQADCVFYATDIKELDDQKRHLHFEATDLELFNPNTQTCIVVRSNEDLKLCRKIYQQAPVFVLEAAPEHGNPWHIQTMRMFDMTNDSNLFHSSKDADSLVPLYEGKLFQQFDHRWATFEPELGDFRDVSSDEKKQHDFLITPRYWIEQAEVQKKLATIHWTKPWMFVWRSISRASDERTLICTVLPSKTAAGNSISCMLPEVNDKIGACLLSTLSSLVIDYIERIKQSNPNVNLFILKQLPILPPEAFKEADIEFICKRVAMLTRTADDINAVWLTEYPSYTFQEPAERLKIRAELDAYIARMYHLTREELRYILDPSDVMGPDHPSVTFPGLKNKQIKEFGEYLTQRLVLEAFDALEAGTLK